MNQRLVICALVLALAGCASTLTETRENPAIQDASSSRYVPELRGDAGTVDQMRAAPAPAMPEFIEGTNPADDRNRLAAQGYVLIGTGYFPGAQDAVHADATQQGQQVGAERIALYPPRDGTAARGEWQASYFVRFQLPFGATFRDLHEQERIQLGVAGGVEIGSVVDGTPASRANLRAGDFVLKFDGKAVTDRNVFQRLLKSRAGHDVTLSVVRNGEILQRVVRLAAIVR